MTARVGVGLDIGGTKVLGAVVDAEGRILDEHRVPSPTGSWHGMLDAITTVVGELRNRRPEVETVGIGAAGMVDLDGMIHYAPNVLGFRRTPVRADVEAAIGLPTVVDNDANVAAYAELRFGAARGMTDAIVVTLGTGIGGGVLVGGQVLRGTHGFAAEVGHFQIDPHGPMCACGERGHWESIASGNALGRMAREVVARGGGAGIVAAAGGDLAAVNGVHVGAAAARGEGDALLLLAQYADNVALGLAGLANILDPERIVIAGGIVELGPLLFGPLRDAFGRHVEGSAHRPPIAIVPAELGERAGAVGAAVLARELLS